jgi:nucleoside 2-deoxyribosyltransferase
MPNSFWKSGHMDAEDRRNDRLRRCFIVAPPGRESARIARVFTERGVECFRPEEIVAAEAVSEEILRHLASADFAVASLHGSVAPNLAFELGVAHALRKPILIFTTNYDRIFDDLRGIYVVRAEPDGIEEAGPDIDRFLRYAKETPAIEAHAPRRPPLGDFTWAHERVAALKSDRGPGRGLAFERLVSEVFQQAGGEVVEATADAVRQADLVVWLNDVAFETGGPMIVECKHFGGGSGSILLNAKHSVERLEKLVGGSDASLGLLVFSHDRPNPPTHVFETPRVLSFAVEQLIDAIERGTFTDEVLQRRGRAASKLGTAVASD